LQVTHRAAAPVVDRELRWRARWWPLTDADGDHFVLDADPGPGGSVGQVVTFDNSYARPRIVVASSLAEWLAAYADCLEQEQFAVDDMGIWVQKFQG
jgi:cell wall assembly regulator SMI1